MGKKKEHKVNEQANEASELKDLLFTLPEEAQYSIYHGLISAGGFSEMVRPMTATELESGKTIATLLHEKFVFGHGK